MFKGSHDPQGVRHDPAHLTDFTVTGAQLYFHKPKVFVASNVVTPLPIGLIAEASGAAKELTVEAYSAKVWGRVSPSRF